MRDNWMNQQMANGLLGSQSGRRVETESKRWDDISFLLLFSRPVGSLNREPVRMLPPAAVRQMWWLPSAFSTSNRVFSPNSPRRWRTLSMTSTSSRSLNPPDSRRNRRSTSSGSTIPEITIYAIHHSRDHASFTYFRIFSPDPLLTTSIVPPLERRGSLVQITLTIPFVDDRPPPAPPLVPTVPN